MADEIISRHCKACGSKFKPVRSSKKFCGLKCFHQWYWQTTGKKNRRRIRKPTEKKACKGCDATFSTSKYFKRFCTEGCCRRFNWGVTHKRRTSDSCASCGNVYTVKINNQKFCSVPCRNNEHERRNAGRRCASPRISGKRAIRPYSSGQLSFPEKICTECNVSFHPNRSFQEHCSIRCQRGISGRPRTKTHVLRSKCYRCSNPLMPNSKSLCEEHWYKAVMCRYGFPQGDWVRAKALMEEQAFTCPYTGEKITPGINASFDHKLPRSKFPKLINSWENVEWVDKPMNSKMCAKNKSAFKRVEIKKPPPTTGEGSFVLRPANL